MARKALLVCGILSSLLYVAMNVFIPIRWDGYNAASQTISDLSAIDAPTRALWVPLGIVYTLLVAAFGLGVWESAGRNRSLRVLGGLLVVSGIIGLGWPPMHQRAVLASGGATLTDTLHLVWAESIPFTHSTEPFRLSIPDQTILPVSFGLSTNTDKSRSDLWTANADQARS